MSGKYTVQSVDTTTYHRSLPMALGKALTECAQQQRPMWVFAAGESRPHATVTPADGILSVSLRMTDCERSN